MAQTGTKKKTFMSLTKAMHYRGERIWFQDFAMGRFMGRCIIAFKKLELEVKACRSMPMELDCGICGSSVFFLIHDELLPGGEVKSTTQR